MLLSYKSIAVEFIFYALLDKNLFKSVTIWMDIIIVLFHLKSDDLQW